MDFDSQSNRKILTAELPCLQSDPCFKITSPWSENYNCIAWAMGRTDVWVDTNFRPGHWWPSGVVRFVAPQQLIEAFAAVGFRRCSSSIYEEGFDKIVLYQAQNPNHGFNVTWTHAARILQDGIAHSKFGRAFDGVHSIDIFAGSHYGVPYAFMKRECGYQQIPAAKSVAPKANMNLLNQLLNR